MIFIHGVYFGSDDEIKIAHSQGFLFELFRDTGLYNLSKHFLETKDGFGNENENNKNFEEFFEDDVFDDDDGDDEEENDEFSNNEDYFEDDDNFVINKVANFNDSKVYHKKKMNSLRSPKKINIDLTQSFIESEYSSLNSINKLSYCQNYIDNNLGNKKNKSENCSLADTETNKVSGKLHGRPPTSFNTNRSSYLKNVTKKLTEPVEVLETINKWLKMTKEVIEKRNNELINKCSF